MWLKYLQLEHKLAIFLKKYSPDLLSITMGIIYLWFGILKIEGISPVEELVLQTTHWVDVHSFVVFIGFWEAIIGICFLIYRFRRIGLWLYFLHLPGIFLPLFLSPENTFTAIPFGLTIEGQYVIKNLVFFAAALVLIGSLHTGKNKN